MNALTQEWIDKAEGDWESLNRELPARKAQNYDSACFHAQQCAEKYLKARLQEAGLAFPKTHDLTALLALLLSVKPSWSGWQASLLRLKTYAIHYRYPGASATRVQARTARTNCRLVRESIRLDLDLPI